MRWTAFFFFFFEREIIISLNILEDLNLFYFCEIILLILEIGPILAPNN